VLCRDESKEVIRQAHDQPTGRTDGWFIVHDKQYKQALACGDSWGYATACTNGQLGQQRADGVYATSVLVVVPGLEVLAAQTVQLTLIAVALVGHGAVIDALHNAIGCESANNSVCVCVCVCASVHV